jgi:hypothetical protein
MAVALKIATLFDLEGRVLRPDREKDLRGGASHRIDGA